MSDVLRWLDLQVAEARDALARQVDRTTALAELRSLALEIANRQGVDELSVVELFGAELDEQERARLVSLARRAALDDEESNAA